MLTELASGGRPGATQPFSGLQPAVAVRRFVHDPTSSITYLVYEETSRVGLVIDPVSDFGSAEGGVGGASNERVAAKIDALGIDLQYALETHVHDDHLTGIAFFEDRYGARSVIGAGVARVQAGLRGVLDASSSIAADGRQFDVLVRDGDVLRAGPLRIEVIESPEDALAGVSYRIGSSIFVGDALSARPAAGAPARHFAACIERLAHLPPDTAVFVGHGRAAGGPPLPAGAALARYQAADAVSRALRHERSLALPRDPDSLQGALARRREVLRWNLCAGRPSAHRLLGS